MGVLKEGSLQTKSPSAWVISKYWVPQNFDSTFHLQRHLLYVGSFDHFSSVCGSHISYLISHFSYVWEPSHRTSAEAPNWNDRQNNISRLIGKHVALVAGDGEIDGENNKQALPHSMTSVGSCGSHLSPDSPPLYPISRNFSISLFISS